MGRKIPLWEALDKLENIRIVIQGQDILIEKVKPNLRDDLHQELRDIQKDT